MEGERSGFFADLYRLAPVSMWIEDYSAVRQHLDALQAAGIRDLRAYLSGHPERVREFTRRIRVLDVNERTLQMFGATSQDELFAALDRVFRGEMFEHHIDELVQLAEGRGAFSSQTVNYTLDGQPIEILCHGRVMPGHEHDWGRVLVVIDDISERVLAERRQAGSEAYARGLFEHSPVSLWVEDFSMIRQLLTEVKSHGIDDFRSFLQVHPDFVDRCLQEIRVLDVNRYTLSLFRAPDKHTLLDQLDRVFRDDMRQPFTEQLIDLWNGKTFQTREVVNYALDGERINLHLQFSVLPGHEETWARVQVALTDITARKKAEAYLEFLGKHDVLTRLRNRAWFSDELQRLEARKVHPLTMMVLDLNGLKRVNDQSGHAAGDSLLRRAGEVLAKAVEAPMSASRIGGDEFVILMPGAPEDAAESMRERLGTLILLNNQFYGGAKLSFSIGHASAEPGERPESVLNRADQAMYEEKRAHYAREGQS